MTRKREKQKRGIADFWPHGWPLLFHPWCIQGSGRRMRKDREEEVEENGKAGASSGTQYGFNNDIDATPNCTTPK
jgi:hypothetical protein